MTKEQAIEFANCLKNNYTIDFNDMADFCDMAIKALEQPISDDCVSRQAVIDYLYTNMSWYDENGFLADDTKRLEDITNLVNGVPPVTPTFPRGATNGDVIMAMFPNAKIQHGLYGIEGTPLICLNLGTRYDVHEMSFVADWWNAPYKRGNENG